MAHPQPQRPPGTTSVVGNNDDGPSAEALVNQAPADFEYAEEVKRAAQRYFEQAAHIDQLTTLRNDWRSRALAAENEVARLLEREAALVALIDRKSAAALQQAEQYKTILREICAQYASGGKALIDGFAALDKAGLHVNIGLSSLIALATALTKSCTEENAAGPPAAKAATETLPPRQPVLENNPWLSIDEALAQLKAAAGI